MKRKKENAGEEINALLGGGTEFEGKLSFEGAVRIDGKFTGEIRGEGMIIIGEKGHFRGEIDAGVVMVRGEAQGTLRARKRIEAYTPAKIHADLHSPVLVFGEGVLFEGASHMAGETKEGDNPQNPGLRPTKKKA
ncbi:MAG: polymer-forming cytoskeletal protein [Syntrophaceae bacterium]|nr:polymer-forming cytoskeletal protein [Syntrophaceae bacterium]